MSNFVRKDLVSPAGMAQKLNSQLATKADAIPVVTVTTSGAVTQAIDCDKLYKFTAATSLTITLNAEPSDNKMHVYTIEFTGNSSFSLTVPSTVKWQSEPDPTEAATYQVAICDNVGYIGGGLE